MRRSLAFSLLVCLAVAGGGLVAADTDYPITTESRVIDVPEQTYTFSGSTFTVDSATVVQAGQTTRVAVDAPRFNAEYSLQLRDANQTEQILWREQLTGDADVTVPTDMVAGGSYVLIVNGPDGNFRSVHPVVVSEYESTFSVETPARSGSETGVTVEVSPMSTAGSTVAAVEIVIRDAGDLRRVQLTASESGVFTGTVRFDTTGSREVYAVVRGRQLVSNTNQRQVLDVSTTTTISVTTPTATASPSPTPTATASPSPTPTATASPSPTPTATTNNNGGSNGGGGGGGSSDDNNSDDGDTTQTPTETDSPSTSTPDDNTATASSTVTSVSTPTTTIVSTPTPTDSAPPAVTTTVTSTPTVTPTMTPTPTATMTSTPTDESVITPRQTVVTSETQGETAGTASLSPVVGVLAIVSFGAFLASRRGEQS